MDTPKPVGDIWMFKDSLMKIDELKDSKTIEFFCNYGTFSDRKVEAIVRQISKHDLLINMTPNNMF